MNVVVRVPIVHNSVKASNPNIKFKQLFDFIRQELIFNPAFDNLDFVDRVFNFTAAIKSREGGRRRFDPGTDNVNRSIRQTSCRFQACCDR